MLKEITAQEFDQLAKSFKTYSFYQTSAWAKLKSTTTWKPLFVNYDNAACAAILLRKMPSMNKYIAYCPRGYLCDFNDLKLVEDFNKELMSYLKSKHVFEFIMDPNVEYQQRDINGDVVKDGFKNDHIVNKLIEIGYHHTGFNLHYENLQPRFLFRLNIKDKSYDELVNDFKKETKRRALKKDFLAINVRELKEDEIDVFYSLMEDTANRRNFDNRPCSYYKEMYKTLHTPGILRYMVAEIDCEKAISNINKEIDEIKDRINKLEVNKERNAGKIKEETVTLNSHLKLIETIKETKKEGNIVPLSVVCLLSSGKEAIMLLAGNKEDYLQNFFTSNIIVSELIKLAKEEGFDYYNFYGISGDFNPNNPEYGLYTYKKQYGGEVVELIGQFEYTINKPVKKIYDLLLSVYKRTKR